MQKGKNTKLYKKTIQRVFDEIKETFPFNNKGSFLEFEKTFNSYYKKLEKIENDKDFFILLQKFVRELDNSHTKIGKYPGRKFFKPRNYIVEKIEKKYYLKKKDDIVGEIILIDNKTPKKILNEWLKIMPKNRAERYFLLTGYGKGSVVVKYKDKGKTKKLELKKEKIVIPPREKEKLIGAGIINKKIGYLKIKHWSSSKSDTNFVDKKIDYFVRNKIKALVIDVRGNLGGDSKTARHLTGHFIDKEIHVGTYKRRASEDNFKLKATKGYWQPRKPYLDIPIYVLIDELGFSSNEIFIAALKDNKIATLIGEKTEGGSGNPKKIEIPFRKKHFELFVSTWINCRKNGKIIEGNGINPHIKFFNTLKDIKEKKDKVLERALIEIKKH